MTRTVKLTRKCDICKEPHKRRAVADVKLQASLGGQWAYVCRIHYSLRSGDAFVTWLEPEDD